MRYSGTDRDDDSTTWFSVGQLPVTTTTLVVLVWVATLLVWTAEGPRHAVSEQMAFFPGEVRSGEIWRLFTWPWAHIDFSLWDIISAAIVWLFGTDLEREIGRKRMATLLGSAILIIPLAAVLWSSLLSQETLFADFDLLALTIVLLFCAEHPTRPFFFGIPAWVIAAVIVALEVVNDLANRDWVRLLTVLLAAALIALVARKVGLLSSYDKVPDLKLPKRKPKPPARDGANASGLRRSDPRGDAAPGPGRSGTPKPPKPPKESRRSGPLWGSGRKDDDTDAEIVQMPPRRTPSPAASSVPDVSADDLALDALLDKIADSGLDSLTPAERQSLDDLRDRRRNRPPS